MRRDARAASSLQTPHGFGAWLWSPGKKPSLPNFKEHWGLNAAVISAVDLIKGIGVCAGCDIYAVEGATGNFYTNYTGKGEAAIKAFEDGHDFVYVHVEAPDECGHQGETEQKVSSIEKIDAEVLAPVLAYLRSTGEDFKVMVLPDHPTPVRLRTHTILPVPFFIYASNKECEGVSSFFEESAAAQNNYVANGYTLMEKLIGD